MKRSASIARVASQSRVRAAPNPLWAITVGMGVFFVVIALIMMFD
jgi:hypothetical protein